MIASRVLIVSLLSLFIILSNESFAQTFVLDSLMKGNDFIGQSPSRIEWSTDSKSIFFQWKDPKTYVKGTYTTEVDKKDQWSSPKFIEDKPFILPRNAVHFDADKKAVYEKSGDIYIYDILLQKERALTTTQGREENPIISQSGEEVIYELNKQFYALNLQKGSIRQLSMWMEGSEKRKTDDLSESDLFLKAQQEELIELFKPKNSKESSQKSSKGYLGVGEWNSASFSPNTLYGYVQLMIPTSEGKETITPTYVTKSGYTEDIPTRSKVGSPQESYRSLLYFSETEEVLPFPSEELPGIYDIPAYLLEYKQKAEENKTPRNVIVLGPIWAPNGNEAIFVVRAEDHKDRWICVYDFSKRKLTVVDRQHDDAWIGGPGIGNWDFEIGTIGWMPDGTSIYFQSEKTGYSHLYTAQLSDLSIKALTSGSFEIEEASLSHDKKSWILVTNKVHPGEFHVYHMPLRGGELTQITSKEGIHECFPSPDGKWLALLFSKTNQPTELFLMKNQKGETWQRITTSTTPSFQQIHWMAPEVRSFKATDGAEVFARVYHSPETSKKKAVIFVHGAGYLQNAHKGWSGYYREYMFHNLLVSKGYTVLDIDYRGSKGYGRDCRTGIYRHMGGKDLSDHVDGAALLVNEYGIDPQQIGIYGGSYGGFITLMALFTEAKTFACGAALRSVTDWAHYNHPYTSNILNTPQTDPIAFRRSSPIYFAEGLEDPLLICHGMIDTNVHFQDVVRLSQRLIDLRKENWEMAVYPLEDHGFVHPTSWADEYSRILALFETHLKP